MFYFKMNGIEYKVYFEHRVQDIHFTTCYIREIHKNMKLYASSGVAECSKKDNFNKEIGRKLSLARALKGFIHKAGDRKAVWVAYFEAKNSRYTQEVRASFNAVNKSIKGLGELKNEAK